MSAAAKSAGLARRRAAALLIYVGLLAAPLAGAAWMAADLVQASESRDEALARLERLDRRPVAAAPRDAKPEASAFLAGPTLTVAGAALQQRMQDATRAAGGKVISSRIDLQVARAAEGYIGLTQNLEIDEGALQPLLYDLESGAPYLFLDSVAVQSPRATGEAEGSRMRVVIEAAAQWRESR